MSLQNPPAGYPVMSGIILTTLITAIVHLSFGIPLFVLNGLGYLGLLVLLYAPLAALERFRPAVRYVLIGYTVLTIVRDWCTSRCHISCVAEERRREGCAP